jgi:hypothetical protein
LPPTAGRAFVTFRPQPPLRKVALTLQPSETDMTLGTIVLIVLILMLIGSLPTWGHSKAWGYGPSGGLGLMLIIVIVLLLMGLLLT